MTSLSNSTRSVAAATIFAAACVAFLMTAGCVSAPATAPPVRLDFPAPDDGPGGPELDRADAQVIDEGWQALLVGDFARARTSADRIGPNAAAELLSLQAGIASGGDSSMAALQRLTDEHVEYAAAWLTLSVAAENVGNEQVALDAASRGAELWPKKRWVDRSLDLHQRWVGDRIDTARVLYESDNADAALEALGPAIELDPGNREAVLLKARALIALEEPDRAEATLDGLPRDPEVIRVSGNIAEARGDLSAAMRIYTSLPDDPEAVLLAVAIAERQSDWLTAMTLYSTLPDNRPEKARGLRRAKLRWRVSVMPDYVQEAMNSDDLDRAQLAVVLVSLAPQVETLTVGQVPLLSDVMTLPSQNEILTATRLGLIESDQLLHRFRPQQTATARDVRSAVDNLGRLLDLKGPEWCTDEEDSTSCVAVGEPISGENVARIVIEMVTAEGGDE